MITIETLKKITPKAIQICMPKGMMIPIDILKMYA